MADFENENALFDPEGTIEEELQRNGEMLVTDTLFLDREGFEVEELIKKAPFLDYEADFPLYMASEALLTVFPYWGEKIPEQLREDVEEACRQFVKNTLSPAVDKIGGWGWFDLCDVDLSYDMISSDMSLALENLSRSAIEHDPEALTQYSPSEEKEAAEKEALQFYGETDIEVDKAIVEVEAESDNGEGDLAEWIFDAMTNALAIAGRGNVSVTDMDQIADKCADICGQDLDKFDALKFHVDNDGNIVAFDFNGSHYALNL